MTKMKNIVLRIILGAICYFSLAGPASADTTWVQKQKLLASDGTAGDRFGHSVSVYGDYAIVGANYDDDNGYRSGSAYIFKWDGLNWVQQQKLTASDSAADDEFGCSVCISGDYVIVGAFQYYGGGIGKAYIFWWNGSSWVQQQKLTASDGASEDRFGYGVYISGDYAIVGSPYDDNEKGNDAGSAYTFKRNGTIWVQQQKLILADGAADDRFGREISISGDYAVIGSQWDDDKGYNSGSAYIFKRDGENWGQQAKLLASDGATEDYFGWDVAISGDYAIVGSIWDDDKGTNSGSAYIFKRDGESWVQQVKLTASDGAASDFFGYSVSIDNDFAVVGAFCDDEKGSDSGSAYIFKWDGSSWVQQQKLTAYDGAGGDYFGVSSYISGDYAIVGAMYDDDKGSDSGSAYIFVPGIATVTIDIKPDNVPVAVLSSATFDATTIDRSTVDFSGAHPLPNYCSQLGEIPEDVDGDGLLDIVFYFKTADLNLPPDDMEACLTGRTFSGQEFKGCDSICLLGPVIGDLNNDCRIDFKDFSVFASNWLKCTDPN